MASNNKDLYRYAENKYGNDLNAVHHYETLEVKDAKGRLILPPGQVEIHFYYSCSI